jgi:hypothetical protein
VEEGILDVELMDHPIPGEGEEEDGVNCGELDDGVEGLVKVHYGALGEAPKDPTGLVAVEGAVRGQLVAKEPLVGDHVSAWGTRHQVPSVVGQQGRVLLHSAAPVGVGEDGANGGDRGGVRRSGSRVSRQDQPGGERRRRAESPLGGRARVVVDGDRVVHRQLRAGNRNVGSRGHGLLVSVIDDGKVGEATHVFRRAQVSGRRGSSAPVAVVDEGGVDKTSRGHRRGREWRKCGQRGRVWRRRGRQGYAWRRRGRRGRAWRGNRRERTRGDRTRCGQWRKAGRLVWRGNRIGLKERVEISGWGGANKGKHIFIKNDVTRDDAVGGEVKIVIPLMVKGVAKEEATSGARK